MELIIKLADSDLVTTLSINGKISGGLMVAAIGMSITFLALLFLWLVIIVMSKSVGSSKNKITTKSVRTVTAPMLDKTSKTHAITDQSEDMELVAVITAAIASSLKTSIDNIVVTNIVRVADTTPAWAKVGRTEQINTRF